MNVWLFDAPFISLNVMSESGALEQADTADVYTPRSTASLSLFQARCSCP